MLIFRGVFGWWFQTFCMFIPIPGKMIQFDEHIFQMGWFNHQFGYEMKSCLMYILYVSPVYTISTVQSCSTFNNVQYIHGHPWILFVSHPPPTKTYWKVQVFCAVSSLSSYYAQRKARREKWDKLRCGKYITRWWFQLCFDFHPLLGGNDPIWRAYFSKGLKPPTRQYIPIF